MVIEKRDAALRGIVAGATTLVPYGMDAVSEEGSFQYEEDVGDLIAALSEAQCHRSCSKKPMVKFGG